MDTRRTFIGKGGLVVAGVVAGLAGAEQLHALSAQAKPAMIIDLNRCTGCQACVIACKGYTGTAPEQFNTRLILEVNDNTPSRIIFTPVQCNQCDEPPCVSACPENATFKLDNGIVVTDWDKCTSAGSCIEACPYGARFADSRYGQRVDKCDFCLARLLAGLEPACVEACSSGARIFGDLNNPQGEFSDYLQNKSLAVRKPEKLTKPNIRYVRAGHGTEELA
ncbi:MAG: 4Fe-4S dicluster domain-containing protein [Desulfobulbaceae bacterium]|nr:4Fe-4S dicluster domain-containing protein [Desulfobulbaceae bacterium]